MRGVIGMVLAVFIFSASPLNSEKITLHEALKKGLVRTEIKGIGGHSGSVIQLVITPVKHPLRIVIPSGTMFHSEDHEDQDLFVIEDHEELISQRKTIQVEGFCAQQQNRSPDEGAGFKLGFASNKSLIDLAGFIKNMNYSAEAKQSAVWSVTNGEPIEYIYDDDPRKAEELQNYVSQLTGLPKSWYSTQRQIQLDEDRRIIAEPLKISGEVAYSVKQPGVMQTAIYDSSDKLLFEPSKGMALPRTGDYQFWFNFQVKGWGEGDYKIKVLIDKIPIHVQAFRI
jgi:hypothetical protein